MATKKIGYMCSHCGKKEFFCLNLIDMNCTGYYSGYYEPKDAVFYGEVKKFSTTNDIFLHFCTFADKSELLQAKRNCQRPDKMKKFLRRSSENSKRNRVFPRSRKSH